MVQTETLSKSLDETRALLQRKAPNVKVAEEAISNLDRLDELVIDPSGEGLKEIIQIGRKLKREISEYGECAHNMDSFLDQLSEWVEERFMGNTHVVSGQRVEMQPIDTEGLILDIGGGGEGVVGKLNGKGVVAIDLYPSELEETENEALKIVMDATDMKFVASSFEVATSFFTLLYVEREKQEKVFSEVHRVLKEKGVFLIWDVRIPVRVEGKPFFMVRLEIELPDETVSTGYGVRLAQQDVEHFKELAARTGFDVVGEWEKGEIFHLELVKQ
jgi:ubiquinone/menaquinone biosynthesis C-methylase UbiE